MPSERPTSATAVPGATLPSVHTSRTSRRRPSTAGSTWKFTRSTGEKSASSRIAWMASERHLGGEHLDVGVLLKVARLDRARALRLQPEDLRAVDVQHEGHLPCPP